MQGRGGRMTIKELYEEAKRQSRENYDFAICSTDDVNIYIDLAYDYEFDDERKVVILE